MYLDRIIKVNGVEHRKCSLCENIRPLTEFKIRSRAVCISCTSKSESKTKRKLSPPIETKQKIIREVTVGIPDYNKYLVDVNEYKNINYKVSGIYFFYSSDKKLLYVGKASGLRSRIKQHLKGTTKDSKSNTDEIKHNFKYLSYMVVDDPVERALLEILLINELKPLFNFDIAYYEKEEGMSKYYKDGGHTVIDLSKIEL